MDKKINIKIDRGTFPNVKIRNEFMKLEKIKTINIDGLLLDTAISTRSPIITGFNLSDYWAWLRYGESFDVSSELKLKNEWKHVDPHQKTILSDELGVGSTTHILKKHLGFKSFVDTQYMMNVVMPNKFNLVKKSKVGPSKAPDYIGRDKLNNLVALECKGTQNTISALNKSMDKGIVQKNNLAAINKKTLKLGLVGGLFIPQNNSKEKAIIIYKDPEWDEFESMIESISKDMIVASIIQGSFAKQLALAGLKKASLEVATNDLEKPALLSKGAINEIVSLKNKEIVYNPGVMGASIHSRIFSAQINMEKIGMICNGKLSVDNFIQLDELSHDDAYQYIQSDSATSVVTPEGFTFEITRLPIPE